MIPITTQVVTELDVLYGLYQMALDCTQNLRSESGDNYMKWIDYRQRILGRADATVKNASHLLKIFSVTKNVPANEQALVKEKKQMVKDVMDQMQKNEFEVMKNMGKQMLEIRKDLANLTRKNNAAKAYYKAPRPALVYG